MPPPSRLGARWPARKRTPNVIVMLQAHHCGNARLILSMSREQAHQDIRVEQDPHSPQPS